MRIALPRPLALVPVCSQAGSRLAAFPVLRAGREEGIRPGAAHEVRS